MGAQRCELLTLRSLRTERCESANVRMCEGGGRADGPHRPIEWIGFGVLSDQSYPTRGGILVLSGGEDQGLGMGEGFG
jgi:hypothetical protein